MIKICPICKKEFTAGKGNIKYCSPDCRTIAEYTRHRDWIERTNYKSKMREDMRQRRAKEAQDHREHLQQQYEERQKQIQKEKERQLQELQERAAAGDYSALMKLAEKDGDRIAYYKYYALCDIEREETDFGRKSTRTINGISVYDPDFAELVVKSIDETGHCINKTNGLGAKIELVSE